MTEKKYVLVCMNVDCRARGAGKVMDRLQSGLQGDGCGDVELRSYMCFGGWKSRTGILNKPAAFWFPGGGPNTTFASFPEIAVYPCFQQEKEIKAVNSNGRSVG